jgi:DNA mismatch repair protein MutH
MADGGWKRMTDNTFRPHKKSSQECMIRTIVVQKKEPTQARKGEVLQIRKKGR